MRRTKASIVLEITAWILAALLLIGTFIYYGVASTDANKDSALNKKCPDFNIELYVTAGCEGGRYSPSDSLGKVTVLNFWYTNCGPCLQELPHFNDLQEEYGEKVRVIAIHSYSVDKKVNKQNFINNNVYKDYVLSFGQDTEDQKIFDMLGGKSAYPMTVILDKTGTVRVVNQGAMTKEALEKAVGKYL